MVVLTPEQLRTISTYAVPEGGRMYIFGRYDSVDIEVTGSTHEAILRRRVLEDGTVRVLKLDTEVEQL